VAEQEPIKTESSQI